MYSFYVFEGSFHQGGGGWEDIGVGCDLAAIQQAAVDYIRLGNWASAAGKINGLEVITFDEAGSPCGGAPETGGEYADRLDDHGYVWVLTGDAVWGGVAAHGTGPVPEDEPSEEDGRWLVAGYNSIHA